MSKNGARDIDKCVRDCEDKKAESSSRTNKPPENTDEYVECAVKCVME